MPPVDTHRINLMPVAVRVRREGRQFVFGIVAAGVVVVLLLGFLFYQKGQELNRVKRDVEAQKKTNSQLQQEIKKLDFIVAKQQEVQRREAIVKDSWGGEISWYRVLQDIATTMPSQTWLTSYSSSRTGGATTAPTGPVIVGGQFTVAGKGFDHPDAADWLARISQIREVVGLWLSSSSVSGTEATRSETFSSAGSLTSEAWSPRAKKAASSDPTAIYEGTNAQ